MSCGRSVGFDPGHLAGHRRELRLRTNLQTIDQELTLRSDESGAATELVVCLSISEAPQKLLLLRRQMQSFHVPRYFGTHSTLKAIMT